MIIKKNETISSFQLFFYMVIVQLNVATLTLPMYLYKESSHDGWISLLFSCLYSVCTIFLYSFLLKRFPNLTIFEICTFFFGKWIGGILKISYILYFIFIAYIINQSYLFVFSKWVFPNSPTWSILLLLLIIGIYLGKENIRTMTRFFQLSFWTILIIFIFSIEAFQQVEWKFLLPVAQVNFAHILKGSYTSYYFLHGFECLLVVYPFVKGPHRKKIKSSIFSILIITLINLFTVVLCFIFFSKKELQLIPEPTIYIFKTLTFFKELERLDLLFLSVWFVIIASSYVSYLNLANIGISNLIKRKRISTFSTITICIIVFLIGNLVPSSNGFIDMLIKTLSFSSFIFILLIPTLILCISLLFKIKSKEVKLS
ncbi:GerAB/ArcD/ProY family transporter [Gottfriedia acidiceleris]|uniref:GerAB/ArcD/ProY family transporter n=1 Tax=Gottfriedia acidiceleris TaxID=371036 RepID=UPI00101D8141|nr:GerAB/ArcD/ProY family transporter [Gottfriedia acidiceleris]